MILSTVIEGMKCASEGQMERVIVSRILVFEGRNLTSVDEDHLVQLGNELTRLRGRYSMWKPSLSHSSLSHT